MTTPRLYKTEAIVLRQRKLGEADRILTLHTPAYGKLDAKAKGVRKTTSRPREVEIPFGSAQDRLRSDAPPEDRALFGVAQNDRGRRAALTRAMEGRQEVQG